MKACATASGGVFLVPDMIEEKPRKRRSFRYEELIDRLEEKERGSRSLLSSMEEDQKRIMEERATQRAAAAE